MKPLRSPYRSYYYIIAAFLLLPFFSGCVSTPRNRVSLHPSHLTFPSLTFTPPKPERVTLQNGIVLYLMEDHEVPLITINAIIRTGAVYEPPEKTGLASITGKVMRTGGTKGFSPEELDKKLEYMGAGIETDIGLESGSASLSVLKKDFTDALQCFAEVVRFPVFSDDKVELEKMKVTESLRRQNDEPFRIASREFKHAIYKGDPRGRKATIEAVNKITREDLLQFHATYFFPDNIIMGISGDFNKEEMMQLLSKYLGDWKKKESSVPPPPIPSQQFERTVVYAQRPLPQSTILLGHLSCPKNHPDFYPMEVLNYILGDSALTSRLMQEIRSNLGLAYSVGSFYRADIDYGVFGVYSMTKSDSTGRVIDLILKELSRLIDEGVTRDELSWAKESILNQFIFSFASTSGLVNSYISLEYDNLPMDYLETYPQKISAITQEDILRVAKRYLHPAESTIVIIGNAAQFDVPLDNYGKVEEADLTIL